MRTDNEPDNVPAPGANLVDWGHAALINAMAAGVIVHNEIGDILLCNEAALTITGLSREQLSDSTFRKAHLQMVGRDGLPLANEPWSATQVFATGNPQTNVVMGFRSPGKNITWINAGFLPLRDPLSKKVTAVAASFYDISNTVRYEEESSLARQKWLAVLNNSKSGIFLLDAHYDIQLINDQGRSMLELIGSPNDEKSKVPFIDRLPLDRREPVRAILDKVLTGDRVEYEVLYRKVDGEDLWLMVSYTPVKGSAGRIEEICITANNITVIKRKEAALVKSEQRWKFALEGAGDGVWEYNFETKESYYSPLYKSMLGYNDDEFRNDVAEWTTRIHPDDLEKVAALDKQYADGEIDHHSLEYRLKNKSGSYLWILDRGMVIERYPEGSALKLIGTHKNINDRKLWEERITQSEHRFSSFMANTPTMTWIIDENAVFRYLNEPYMRAFNLSHTHIGRSIHEIFPPEICQGFIANNWRVWDTEDSVETIEEGIGPDGNKQFYHIFKFPLEPQNGVRMLGGVALDITKKIQVERKLNEEENKKKREIIQAIIDAQEKERKEIAYELHDNVNQILTSAKLMLEVAEEKPDLTHDFMTRGLNYLNEAIIEIRKISHSLTPGTLTDISLDAAIAELVQTINSSGKINMSYQNTIGANESRIPPEIKLSALRITQEQLNNIIKHAQATEATVTLDIRSDRLSISISDNGIGFEPNAAKKGLGLNNIFNRVEYYHGNVNLKTSPGKGCVLYLEFPVSVQQE